MKQRLLCVLLAFAAGFFLPNLQSNDNNRAFSKRKGLALLDSPSPGASKTATADWNEELDVLEQKGRWYKVGANKGEGWVYSGNISWKELPKENQNDVPFKSSGVSAAAAARGLSDAAGDYAERNDLGEVASQLSWAEDISKGISADDARAYLKQQKLGEYAEEK